MKANSQDDFDDLETCSFFPQEYRLDLLEEEIEYKRQERKRKRLMGEHEEEECED